MPTPNSGSRAIDSTTIPIPPSQWLRHRQKSMPWGRASMSVKMVAAVVVKPDIVSKKASAADVVVPLSIKGSIPKNEKSIHTIPTIR